jgi:hypothetical protein
MRTCNGRRLLPWLAWSLLLAVGPRAGAQEVDWQTDYTWARSLAATTGRPLLLSIGGERCVECLRLHSTTFRDPNVAALLGQHFIAVQMDAQKDMVVVRALGLSVFPVVILAAADGTVMHSLVGFVEPAQMTQHINLALFRLQRYRAGIRPGSEAPRPYPGTSGTAPQVSQSYYPPQNASLPQTGIWSGSPYSYSSGQTTGGWTTPYLWGYRDYFGTPRRC